MPREPRRETRCTATARATPPTRAVPHIASRTRRPARAPRGVARLGRKLQARRGVSLLGATHLAAQPMLARHATWGSHARGASCTRDAVCCCWVQRTSPRSLCSPLRTQPGGRAPRLQTARATLCIAAGRNAPRRAAYARQARNLGSRTSAANCTRDNACRCWVQRTSPRSLCSPGTQRVAHLGCKLHARQGVSLLGATHLAAQPTLARHAT
jgi:hypothetical protein